ncbi:TRAP transporter fused permease subunit [Pikeienuella piscinae]|uniref:TRAP transporter fused permease subunit n=1 Tax=Pikeienuella piscinae TaxID=2748098 RepID=A0A7L5C3S2_9RHOB|nr:TRAP transporter fused permease subunit [Pikeienuella piscinae]QIE56914.1 TRAP transporter fused permease subunit [Pikeienuella piscinae]
MNIFALAFDTGARRRPEGLIGRIVRLYAGVFAAWSIYAAGFSRADTLTLTITFVSLMLVLTFLLITPGPGGERTRIPPFEWLLAAAALGCGLYFVAHGDEIAERITLLDPLSTADMIAASTIVILALEATRRAVGLGLLVIVLLFIAYNLFGDRLSGAFGHGEISLSHFLDIMVFTTDGLFGVPIRVAATYAFLFVIFGTALAKTGGADFFFDIAAAMTGRSRGGPAKIAVISSGLYGTISGSPTSDVVTTGSITIPMMKRLGYKPAFAGAVEVAASTGGSLVPPVMGAAAFIMAEYTGIDYVDIALAAIIPALLYYLPIYLQVHLRANKIGLKGLDPEQIPPIGATLRKGGLFIVPLLVITWALVDGYTPTYAAIYGMAAVVVVSMLRRETRMTPGDALDVLADSCVKMVAVTGACAAAGLVIGGITMTGLASKFGTLVFFVSGHQLIISLIVAAALTILLGLGMPTPSAYILAATLIAPVMSRLGVDLMAGHLFLLYFAVMSALTPPVAVAAYAASAIADEAPLKIAVTAVSIAIGAFLIPFAFIFDGALILQGAAPEIALACVLVASGLALVAVAQEGYLNRPIGAGGRLLCLGIGLFLIFARPVTLHFL